jgi:hypothetical protein
VPLVALLFLLAASLVSSCTASHNVLGTGDNPCFRVIPEARAAVHDRGTFEGTTYVAPEHLLRAIKHRNGVPDSLQDVARMATCLVAFKGDFTASDVELGWAPHGPGKVAVVVVRQRNDVVVATVVLHREPLRFGHFFSSLQ